jgi:hypothetical protein
MSLDYKDVCDTTKKIAALLKQDEKPLTEKEKTKILFYIDDMEKHILDIAKTGKNIFVYDCSKLTKKMFVDIAEEFKERNPLFFVLQDSGIQMLTIQWGMTNEV